VATNNLHPDNVNDGAQEYDPFEAPADQPDLETTRQVPLHESRITTARIYLLRGEPETARRLVGLVPTEIETPDLLRRAIRAHHIFAEASLEIGTLQALADAVEATQQALALATRHKLAGAIEDIYGDAMALTLLEAIRRSEGLSGQNMRLLETILEQISTNSSDIRYGALTYVGYRTLGLSMENGRPRTETLLKATDARDRYLQAASLTPHDVTYEAEPLAKALIKNKSALLSALIDFPYPSQLEEV
jgi:hypothetical protein